MKKILKIILLCFLGLFLIGSFLYLKPSKTLDFSGTVTDIKIEDSKYTFKLDNSGFGAYTVIADKGTKVKPCHKGDPKRTIDSIKIGDEISGDYKGLFSKSDKARYIVIYPEVLLAPENSTEFNESAIIDIR